MKLSRMQSIRVEWMKHIDRETEKLSPTGTKASHIRKAWLMSRKRDYFFTKDFDGVEAVKWLHFIFRGKI